jgi:hypothetical protein
MHWPEKILNAGLKDRLRAPATIAGTSGGVSALHGAQ